MTKSRQPLTDISHKVKISVQQEQEKMFHIRYYQRCRLNNNYVTLLVAWANSRTLKTINAQTISRWPHSLLMGCIMVQALWKIIWYFFKKINIVLLYGSAMINLGVLTKRLITCPHKFLQTKKCSIEAAFLIANT